MNLLGIRSFHDMLVVKDKTEECTGSYDARSRLKCLSLLVKKRSSMLFLYQGRLEYLNRFPEATAIDLNQNPKQRAKKATDVMFTLTTGSGRIWLVSRGRYLTGIEALVLHSIPCTVQASKAMRCRQVLVHTENHAAQCFMAGNAMHGSNVGMFLAFAFLYTKPS